jgi:6-phosphogluconolactonase
MSFHLIQNSPLTADEINAMPVDAPDLNAAAQYADTLRRLAGSPPVLDLVHLGLGPDGHTASLVPGDPVLKIVDRDVAITGKYQHRRRMTLTYPILNRARRILWLETGADKAESLARLRDGNTSVPAGRVRQDRGDRAGRPRGSDKALIEFPWEENSCEWALQPTTVDLV